MEKEGVKIEEMKVNERKKTRKHEFIHCTRIHTVEGGVQPVQEA